VESLLLEGLDSGEPLEVTDDWWEQKRSFLQQDETEYLLSTEANRYQLMTAIKNIETKTNWVSFTPEEWKEEYNI
jgi:hypothetical protein